MRVGKIATLTFVVALSPAPLFGGRFRVLQDAFNLCLETFPLARVISQPNDHRLGLSSNRPPPRCNLLIVQNPVQSGRCDSTDSTTTSDLPKCIRPPESRTHILILQDSATRPATLTARLPTPHP